MRNNKLLVDPFMFYELEQLQIIANLDLINDLLKPINLKSLFYSYMLQNGVDRFEVYLEEGENKIYLELTPITPYHPIMGFERRCDKYAFQTARNPLQNSLLHT